MTLELEIAGIHFRASVPRGLRIVLDDPRYAPFLGCPGRGPGRVQVPVRILADEAPDVSRLPVVFESGGAWQAFRDGMDLLLDYRLPPSGERLWTARVSGDDPEVAIHCGATLFGGEPPETLQSPLCYPLDQLLLMYILPLHDGVLVHAAGIRRGDRAVAFPGRSGAGKSTLSRLLAERPGIERMSDDRVVLRRGERQVRAWGTPWAGTERVAVNDSAPLGAIAFLHKSHRTRLRPIDPREGLSQLLPVASVPWFDGDRAARCLRFCDELLGEVPLFELHFRQHADVGEVVAELL